MTSFKKEFSFDFSLADESVCSRKNQICLNTPGSYKCVCKEGYKLDELYERDCREVNECKANEGKGMFYKIPIPKYFNIVKK